MTRIERHITLALFFVAALFLSFSCKNSVSIGAETADTLQFKYASLLHISRNDSFMVCDIENPWQRGHLLHRYIIVGKDQPLPKTLPEGTLLRTPLDRTVAFSSAHASLFYELGARDRLCGLCDIAYIQNDTLLHDVQSGRLADMGAAHQPDIEKLISARPEALFVSPFAGVGYGALERLGIPLIECADYMETSPLGRAEWMRFYAILLSEEDTAKDIFLQVEKEYQMLADKSEKKSDRPALLVDNVQSGVWYVPCGKSTMGVLFRDAGANYLFSYLDGSGSQTLSPETVLRRGKNADLWIIKYGAPQDISYESLAADFALYRELKAWKERKVFGCNVSKTPFFEETPFHPERLLQDISYIVAHSASKSAREKSWTDSLRYFKPL